jgi:Rrf2 family transcriptional regulator, iron-sulfur cluster assembly transcription factor
MVLSKTSTYALRILIFMAGESGQNISASSLYKELGIKKQYLRRLLTDLSKSGLIQSTMGRNGGYVFSRDPASIYIYEVIDAIEGFSSFEGCIFGITDCKQSPQCAMHNTWANARDDLVRVFRNTSLVNLKSGGLV